MALAFALGQIVTALGGVGVGAVVSLLIFRAGTRRQANNELREQLLELVELRYEQRRIDQNPDDADHSRMSRLLNAKRNIRLAMARDVARTLTRRMNVYDCVTLGFECDSNAEYEEGRHFLELAVSKAQALSPITQAEALRYLGQHYLDPGPEHDSSKGSSYYAAAVQATSGDSRPYFVYTTALSYRAWAGKLKNLGDDNWRGHALKAKRLFESLPDDFTYKESELRDSAKLLGEEWPPARNTEGPGEPPGPSRTA